MASPTNRIQKMLLTIIWAPHLIKKTNKFLDLLLLPPESSESVQSQWKTFKTQPKLTYFSNNLVNLVEFRQLVWFVYFEFGGTATKHQSVGGRKLFLVTLFNRSSSSLPNMVSSLEAVLMICWYLINRINNKVSRFASYHNDKRVWLLVRTFLMKTLC